MKYTKFLIIVFLLIITSVSVLVFWKGIKKIIIPLPFVSVIQKQTVKKDFSPASKPYEYFYDSDGDGLENGLERRFGLDPFKADWRQEGLPDSDSDLVPDANEVVMGTDPLKRDTDGDGFSDYVEILQGLDPKDADIPHKQSKQPPSDEDNDKDGLTNEQEVQYGTQFDNPDSDGDGYLDGEEVSHGYNPLGVGKLK